MKAPQKPPTFKSLMDHVTPDELFSIIQSAVSSPSTDGRYLHWDQLIRRTPPEGLSHEKWWLALKTQRILLFKSTPLYDKADGAFQFLEVDPIPERLHDIDLGTGGRIQMPEQITNPETRDRYYVSSLIEEAITSSQLEGAATTRQVAKEMLRSGRRPRDKNERMIFNNFATMQRIGELKNEPLTENLVFEIHRLITEHTLDDPSGAGRFRRGDERITVVDDNNHIVHMPPPSVELEERMAAMCDFANGKSPGHFIHPVIRSIILHFWLAAIRDFRAPSIIRLN